MSAARIHPIFLVQNLDNSDAVQQAKHTRACIRVPNHFWPGSDYLVNSHTHTILVDGGKSSRLSLFLLSFALLLMTRSQTQTMVKSSPCAPDKRKFKSPISLLFPPLWQISLSQTRKTPTHPPTPMVQKGPRTKTRQGKMTKTQLQANPHFALRKESSAREGQRSSQVKSSQTKSRFQSERVRENLTVQPDRKRQECCQAKSVDWVCPNPW